MSLRKKLRRDAVPLFLAIYLILVIAGWYAYKGFFVLWLLFSMFGILAAFAIKLLFEIHDLQAAREQDYRQLEALASLVPLLGASSPLPPMRKWASSPDYLAIIAREILSRKPALVVELGSGVSTLVAALCLRKNGSGRIVSVEQDPDYAETTRARLASEDLTGIAEVIHAPLAVFSQGAEMFRWYDTAQIDHLRGIDLLIIDGPSVTGQKAYLRYPALPFFAGRKQDGMAVILDDAAREDEQRCIVRWQKEFPKLTGEFVLAEKGAWVGKIAP